MKKIIIFIIAIIIIVGGVYIWQGLFTKEPVNFTAELIRSELNEYGKADMEEVVEIGFSRDVNAYTLNSETVRLCAVGVSVGSAGMRSCLTLEDLNFDYNEKVLTITSRGMIIGSCAACVHELELTEEIKDIKGNSLNPIIFGL